MSDYAIKVDNLTKDFLLPHTKNRSLKQAAVSLVKRNNTVELQQALNNVSFEIKKGEFFGIVGRNGSGKSTLLKILAGVYRPTKGSVKINGSLVPFIELGVGFNPELSGRDNVFLNGALLGFSRREMAAMYDEIVEFAELEKFMDQKLKNYSSGMYVRLAFSIAIKAESDILLLDEVLAVGDTAFQKKCFDYFEELMRSNKTIILVTHSMGIVEQFCDRAMLINNGQIIEIGDPVRIADLYNELNLRNSNSNLERQNRQAREAEDVSRKAKIISAETYNPATNKKQDTFTYKEKIGVRYHIKLNEKLESLVVGLVFKDKQNNTVFATNTLSQNVELNNLESNQKLQVEFEVENVFTNANYQISGATANNDKSEIYHRVDGIHEFEVGGWKMPNSLTHPKHLINVKRDTN